jgi:hypothetical protein
MLTQRPPGAAPAVQVFAEQLPFPGDGFDAAMGALTIHHWSDRRQELGEMRRVASPVTGVCCFCATATRAAGGGSTGTPGHQRLVAVRETRLEHVAALLGELEIIIPVRIPADCRDGLRRRSGDGRVLFSIPGGEGVFKASAFPQIDRGIRSSACWNVGNPKGCQSHVGNLDGCPHGVISTGGDCRSRRLRDINSYARSSRDRMTHQRIVRPETHAMADARAKTTPMIT